MRGDEYLDGRYFVDGQTYNCPFCKRRHVAFSVLSHQEMHWSQARSAHVFFVQCRSCTKISLHISREFIPYGTSKDGRRVFSVPCPDDFFFLSVPRSSFVLDSRITRNLRELLAEAEGCLQGGFLTGASACARKLVYEIAKKEEAGGGSFEERVKSLKSTRTDVAPEYFDTLLTIQEVASEKVHEGSYDGWEPVHLQTILATLKEILFELYVLPAERTARKEAILGLRSKITEAKAAGGAANDTEREDLEAESERRENQQAPTGPSDARPEEP